MKRTRKKVRYLHLVMEVNGKPKAEVQVHSIHTTIHSFL